MRLVIIVTICLAITDGFLLGSTLTTIPGFTAATTTSPLPRYPTTPDSYDCDMDGLTNCTREISDLVTGDTVDPDLLYEFSCGDKGRVLLDCIQHYDDNCTGDSVVKDILAVLPDPATMASVCNGTSKTKMVDIQQCVVRYTQDQGYMDCVAGNNTLDPSDPKFMCSAMQTGLDCAYKYVELTCPDLRQDFVDLYRAQYNGAFANCHLSLGALTTGAVSAATTSPMPAARLLTTRGDSFGTSPPMPATGTSPASSAQKSLLLQMVLHVQHQAESLQRAASDLEQETRLLYSLLQGSSVSSGRK